MPNHPLLTMMQIIISPIQNKLWAFHILEIFVKIIKSSRKSQAGIVLPVFLDLLHDKRLYRVVREVRVIPFVVWLSAVTKQPAQPNTSVARDSGDPTASWSEVNGETTVGRDGSGDVRVIAGGFVRVDAVTEDI